MRFVIVRHPHSGAIFLPATDLTLEPLEIVLLYGYRFKIELAFARLCTSAGVMPIISGWPP